MFDTVKAYYQTFLDIESFERIKAENQLETIITKTIDTETGELSFTAQIKNHKIPFIKYFSKSATLFFELSIPKYQFGSNLPTMTERDFEMFYFQLHQDFLQLFNIDMYIPAVTVIELHVCENLDISSTGYNMQEWLQFIAQQEIPRKPHITTYQHKKQLTGVVFKANPHSKDRVTFYDKGAEIKQKNIKHEYQNNFLRLEVKTSKHERKPFGNKLVDLLNKNFFHSIMEKYQINQLLKAKFHEEQPEIPYFYLVDEKHYKVYQIEKLAGHLKIKEDLSDQAKFLYEPKTFENRQKELDEFNQIIKDGKTIDRKVLQVTAY